MSRYRVEVVQTTVLHIKADSKEKAKDIATEDYIWEENQTSPNRYNVHFNIEEVYVGDEKENQTYFLQTRENESE